MGSPAVPRGNYWHTPTIRLTHMRPSAPAVGGEEPSPKRHRANGSGAPAGAFFSLGLSTHRVPMDMYNVARAKVVRGMQAAGAKGVALLCGVSSAERDDTDRELLARQESYFAFAFGVTEPDCYGLLDITSGQATLLIPRLPQEYATWMGRIHPPSHFQAKYAVDSVRYVDELGELLKEAPEVHVLHGQNTDSRSWAKFTLPKEAEGALEKARWRKQLLLPTMREARVVKSAAEIDVLRYVARISSQGHVRVMQSVKPGMAEWQLEATFQHYCYYYGGCRNMSYLCNCSTGPNSAVLHYGGASEPNTRVFKSTDMALLDMGAEYACYCSDITCSFPISGKFSADQRLVYEAVLAAQTAVFAALKPGIEWTDMHRRAERALLEALTAGGMLRGDVDAMMAAHMGAVFMPHGLGHLLGLDTHDVGGFVDGRTRIDEPGLRSLRMNRPLEEGMYLTVEPGCYFIDHVLDAALANPQQAAFIVPEVLQRFRGFGGVRLEDDVLITATGMENFTVCPRTVAEVEAVMAGAPWPPLPSVHHVKTDKPSACCVQ